MPYVDPRQAAVQPVPEKPNGSGEQVVPTGPSEIDSLKDTVTALAQQVKNMADSFGATVQQMSAQQSSVLERMSERPDPGVAPPPSPEKPMVTTEDLERMSRGDLVQFMLERFNEVVDEKYVKPVRSELEEVRRDTSNFRASSQVERATEKFEDFWDWRSEMKMMAQEHPTLNVEQLYKLARLGNVEKANQMDEKYKVLAEDPESGGMPPLEHKDMHPTEERAAAPSPQGEFGGLHPGGMQDLGNSGALSVDDALDKAWADTKAQFGDDAAAMLGP